MAKKDLPSVELLRQLVRYEPETGKLYWLPRTPDMFRNGKQSKEATCNSWNVKNSGKEAGWVSGNRIQFQINKKEYKIHRIIWKLHYGVDPVLTIDHINGNGLDNRIINLREADYSQQAINKGLQKSNTMGVKGVYLAKKTGKFYSQIWSNNKTICLGHYKTFEEAVAARKAAEVKYHGEYARAS